MDHFLISLLKGCLNHKTFTLRHHDTHISHHVAAIILSAALSFLLLPSPPNAKWRLQSCHDATSSIGVHRPSPISRQPNLPRIPPFRYSSKHLPNIPPFSYRVLSTITFIAIAIAITSIISILIVTHTLFPKDPCKLLIRAYVRQGPVRPSRGGRRTE
jgi:hypothetical protein